jgi:hypothetical protein
MWKENGKWYRHERHVLETTEFADKEPNYIVGIKRIVECDPPNLLPWEPFEKPLEKTECAYCKTWAAEDRCSSCGAPRQKPKKEFPPSQLEKVLR